MDHLFNYTAIATGGAFMLEVIALFRTESIERVLLNERKKLLLAIARITILAISIFLLSYGFYFKKDPSMNTVAGYVVILMGSFFLGWEIYYLAGILIVNDLGNNYFIEDERYGKVYLIKSSNSKYILLADKPWVKDSKFVLFESESIIEGKKICSESKKTKKLNLQPDS
jgi:hypothetical protein